MVPVLQMLTQWALEMLGRAEITLQGRKGKNPLQPSSIATYLSAIDQELLACSGKDTITLYDPEELRDLYDDVVKAVKGNNKKHTASFRLTQFHRFLMRTYGAPLIDMDGMVATKGPPELGVDANILSPHMFRSALFSLGWELPQRSRIQTIRCLVANTRATVAGLRRHEALALRIGDVMGETAPEILIRTSYLNRLKTTDSARRLPLYFCWNLMRQGSCSIGDRSALLKRTRTSTLQVRSLPSPAPGSWSTIIRCFPKYMLC